MFPLAEIGDQNQFILNPMSQAILFNGWISNFDKNSICMHELDLQPTIVTVIINRKILHTLRLLQWNLFYGLKEI